MLFSQRNLQLAYQSDTEKLRNWAVAVGIHVVVAAYVETKNQITAGTLLRRWEPVGRIPRGLQKQAGQNIEEICTDSSHTLM